MNMTSAQTEPRKLSSLRPHEFHIEVYPDLAEAEFEELVEDIRQEGIRVALEVLPDGRILTGRHRHKAAEKLGLKTVPVVVRHDLAEAGEAAIRTHIIRDNLVRRQLSPLGQARALLKLKEANGRQPGRGLTDSEAAELRDQIGERLSMSGRNAGRYLAILRTPRAVQDAFERGKLSLTLAARVATLTRSNQKAIADALEADQEANPGSIVTTHLDARLPAGKTARGAYSRLLRDLRVGVDQLSGQVASIPRLAVGAQRHLSTLRRGLALIRELIEFEKQAIAEQAEDDE
jgi:ParB-like chromosome segregation protein Spo0J